MQRAARGGGLFAVAVVLASLGRAPTVRAEDLTTLSGRTFRQVRMLRVEPDGVIWEHATGMCKVDFTDLPDSLRLRYHYNAAQAAAFQVAQAQTRQQTAALVQQAQRLAATRRVQHFQQQQAEAGSETEAKPGTFVYHRDRTPERAAEALGAQVAERKAALEKLTEDDGTIYDRRLWAIPRMIVGLSSDGHAFDPPDVNSPEYQRSLRHAPADKEYYKDVDRAEAFARGAP